MNGKTDKDLADILCAWVKHCEYTENDERTDAVLVIGIEGISKGNVLPLDKVIAPHFTVEDITDEIARRVASEVASRFCDTVTVEEIDMQKVPKEDDVAVTIRAQIHLAE